MSTLGADPTDSDVIRAVAAAKRTYRASTTRAQSKFRRAEEAAWTRFGSSDVEQSARHNAIRRAETTLDIELDAAREKLNARLRQIRLHAGQWADLVPASHER